ncbi:hypothetical protein [Campylobacter sp. RM16192]|uniref:hypothetical protein n=1 Tax=Campylobacter sp. RM16192 TaxID=1660080 RepID=UPI00163AC15D|nr:hypothetical protein [Campylobacter sp. RM16192]
METGMRIGSLENLQWSYFSSNFETMTYPKQYLKGAASTMYQREDLILPLSKM